MQGLLVTFCNNSPPDFIFGVLDFESECFRWIDTAPIAPESAGATGLVFAYGHYWVVRQDKHSSIIKLDSELRPTHIYPLPISQDAHSIVPFDDGFLIADTLHNGINLARLSDDASTMVESEFWWQYRGQDDEIHVNSVCCADDNVYVSFFGEKPGNGWASSQVGQIVNINTGEVICENLRHPHTMLFWNGDVYWLESKAGLVHKYTPGGKHEVVLKLNGYVRGLAFDGDFMYVGASAARRHSRSMGTLNKIASDNPDDFCCWIYRVSRQTGKVDRCNMTAYGSEIYDLLPMSTVPFEMNRSSNGYAMARRLWRIEDGIRAREDHFRATEDAWQHRMRECESELVQCKDTASQLGEELARIQKDMAHIQGTRWWRARLRAGQFLQKWL